MRQVPQVECLDWLRDQGIDSDGEWNSFRYFGQPGPEFRSKSWKVPELVAGLAGFWSSVFEILPSWKGGMMLYPRDEKWESTNAAPDEPDDFMYTGFFRKLGVNLAEPSGIFVANDERAMAAWILYTRLAFGGCVGDDTLAVPEGGAFLITTSHHDYIDVQFRDRHSKDEFDGAMAELGYDFVRWTRETKEAEQAAGGNRR